MRWVMVMIMVAVAVSPACCQELLLLGGGVRDIGAHERSYAWQLEYLEGLGEHAAVSLSYLNEGHVPVHHRDGNALQLWLRTTARERRLSLAAGFGPYYYYDTTKAKAGASFSDDHGWGGVVTLAATWYTQSRWLFQLRSNWVETGGSIDTLSTVFGIGYQLAPPPSPGPLVQAPPQPERKTNNELTLFVGRTIVNSFNSEHSAATAVEYRRGLGRHLDWTASWLYEGDNRLFRRNGIATQLWAVRSFFDEGLALGIGGGAYVGVNHYGDSRDNVGDDRFISGIVTLTAGCLFHPHWDLRTSWNRIVTTYNRDTDVILAGVGYRF